MCAAFTLRKSAKEIVSDLAVVTLDPSVSQIGQQPLPDIFPKRDAFIITAEAYEPILKISNWGMFPRSADYGDMNSVIRPFNAKSETVADTYPFKFAWAASRRCVIPVTTFTEWEGEKGSKKKLFISQAGEPYTMIAGLWDETDRRGFQSFTMLTCKPNAEMEKIHHRMPVILEDWLSWLDPEIENEDAHKMLRPFRGELEIHR